MENNAFISASFGAMLEIMDARAMIHVFEIDDAGHETRLTTNGAIPVYRLLPQIYERGVCSYFNNINIYDYAVVGITTSISTAFCIKKRF